MHQVRKVEAMTAPFDWATLIFEACRIAKSLGTGPAAAYLRTRIQTAFVPVERYENLKAVEQWLIDNPPLTNAALAARAEAAEAENARLREALVEAAIPLQAMRLAGTVESFSPEMREGVENAVQRINQALGGEHEHG